MNKEAPPAAGRAWDQIIEGVVSAASGKLILSDYEGEAEIFLKPGAYKFQVYFATLDPGKYGREKCAIYLWPSGEGETDEIRILKRSAH